MNELAGTWTIELPESPLFFDFGMVGWRETKFVLNANGSCEIYNLTLKMTNIRSAKKYPELTGKKLTGAWESSPVLCSGAIKGEFARIAIDVIVDDHVAQKLSIDTKYTVCVSLVWKVTDNKLTTYRLQVDGGDSIDVMYGIILKRVE